MEDIRKIERKIKIHLSKKKRRMKIEEDKKIEDEDNWKRIWK